MAMTAPQSAMVRGDFDIGRVGRETFEIIGSDLPGTYGVAVGLGLIPAVLQVLLAAGGLTHPGLITAAAAGGAFGVGLLMLLVGLVVGVMTYGTLGYGAVERLQGRTPSISQRLSAAGAALLPMIGVGVLGYLGILLGTILVIVPGLFLATMWVGAIVAAVVDRAGVFGSFTRSAELTKGHRWMIFVLILIFFVIGLVLGLVQFALMRFDAGAGAMGLAIVTGLFSVVIGGAVNAIGATGAGVVYQELRRARGEFDPGRLAEVFS